MADWFTGPGGAPGGAAISWATRRDTITNLLAVGHAYGDNLYVGPGAYRETVTLNTPGGAYTYAVGTIDVTNESTAVTGNGTNWAAVLGGDLLFVGNFATAADGITNGTLTFTTAASTPFRPGMVGYMIEIMTRGPYLIAAYTNTSTITLSDPNGLGNPAAAGGLTFYVVSGEGPYEIVSATAAALTLDKPWSGPTLTTIPYIIYRPVRLIGDVTGAMTDGVGGKVRITGSDNDETRARTDGIYGANDDYWLIRGFQIDCCSDFGIFLDACDYATIEDCVIHDCQDDPIEVDDSSQLTIRRCILAGSTFATGVYLTSGPAIDNAQSLIENCYIDCGGIVWIVRSGGVSIKNITFGWCCHDGIYVTGMNTGAGIFVRCSQLVNQASPVGANSAFHAAINGQGISQYNNYFANDTNVTNVTLTAQDTQYIHLPSLPQLGDNVRWPMVPFFAPSEWEDSRDSAGLYSANEDLFGIHNEVSQTRRSWGAMHHYPTKRDPAVAYGAFAAAQQEPDAMEQQHVYNVQEDRTYTITVQVYLDAAYTGNNPQMTVSQPGQADVVATSTGAKGSWEQLTVTFTTGSALDWIAIFLKSRNTSALANKSVRWQDLDVR